MSICSSYFFVAEALMQDSLKSSYLSKYTIDLMPRKLISGVLFEDLLLAYCVSILPQFLTIASEIFICGYGCGIEKCLRCIPIFGARKSVQTV